MLKTINHLCNKSKKYLIELNLSCPNIINKSIVAYDYELLKKYLDIVDNLDTNNLTIGLKLPPYHQEQDFNIVSEIIDKYDKIKFVVCINSVVNGLLVDFETETTKINPKNGLGGIGGVYCKPTALANVHNFYKRLGHKINIIGCGGVITGLDVFEMLLVGASAVQVGTQLMKQGIDIFNTLKKELCDIMIKKGYLEINEFMGKLKVAKN